MCDTLKNFENSPEIGRFASQTFANVKHRPNAWYVEVWRHTNDLDEDMDVPGLK
jgi:hypothetical protein